MVNSSDDSLIPLTPNMILRLQTNVEFPMGVFTKSDVYCKRVWRQAQYLADCFWKRFIAEYLPLLQNRNKWIKRHRSLQSGDVVMVIDSSLPRSQWKLGIVTATNADSNGDVRSAHVSVVDNKSANHKTVPTKTVILRSIQKLVLLRESEKIDNDL